MNICTICFNCCHNIVQLFFCYIISITMWPTWVIGIVADVEATCSILVPSSQSIDITNPFLTSWLFMYSCLPCFFPWEKAAWQFQIPVLYRLTQISQWLRSYMMFSGAQSNYIQHTCRYIIEHNHATYNTHITSETTIHFIGSNMTCCITIAFQHGRQHSQYK